jgi:hypothetical protein
LIDSKAFSFNKDLEEVDDWDRGSTLNSNRANKREANVDHHTTFDSTFKNSAAKDNQPKPKDLMPLAANTKKYGFTKYRNTAVIT